MVQFVVLVADQRFLRGRCPATGEPEIDQVQHELPRIGWRITSCYLLGNILKRTAWYEFHIQQAQAGRLTGSLVIYAHNIRMIQLR